MYVEPQNQEAPIRKCVRAFEAKLPTKMSTVKLPPGPFYISLALAISLSLSLAASFSLSRSPNLVKIDPQVWGWSRFGDSLGAKMALDASWNFGSTFEGVVLPILAPR